MKVINQIQSPFTHLYILREKTRDAHLSLFLVLSLMISLHILWVKVSNSHLGTKKKF